MIRAWTILRGRAKEPWSMCGDVSTLRLQYPVFPTMKDARKFIAVNLQGEKTRLVRCRISIEGSKDRR